MAEKNANIEHLVEEMQQCKEYLKCIAEKIASIELRLSAVPEAVPEAAVPEAARAGAAADAQGEEAEEGRGEEAERRRRSEREVFAYSIFCSFFGFWFYVVFPDLFVS